MANRVRSGLYGTILVALCSGGSFEVSSLSTEELLEGALLGDGLTKNTWTNRYNDNRMEKVIA